MTEPKDAWYVGALLFSSLSLVACSPESTFEQPSRNTDPAVTAEIGPLWYQVEPSEPVKEVTFGMGSADLTFSVGGQFPDSVRTIDLGYPAKSEMIGYGKFRGMRETYRRTLAVDNKGIHGVRTAVYRTDSGRKHTNVWLHHQARGHDGRIYVTEAGQWNWQGGERDLEAYGRYVWPTMQDVVQVYRDWSMFFSVTPVGGAFQTAFSMYAFDTDAVSPTFQVPGCIQLRYYSEDVSVEHIAYLHEELGLVELIYKWEEGGREDQHHILPSWIIPIDGFATIPGSVEGRVPYRRIHSRMKGIWTGIATAKDDPGRALKVTLSMADKGNNFKQASETHDIDGIYTDDTKRGIHIFGKFNRRDNRFSLLSRSKRLWLWMDGSYADGVLNFERFFRFDMETETSAVQFDMTLNRPEN